MGTYRWDGRWLAGACVAVCLATLVVAHFVDSVALLWAQIGVRKPDYPFQDLLALLAGGESMHDGLDPILQNPHDPRGLQANYPHLWFYPLVILGVHQNSTLLLGTAITLAFFASALLFAGPLPLWEGLVWACFLCAPPVILAVVLGNNDLVIFVLLALALVVRSRATPGALGGSYGLIGLCAALKLYPASVFCLALRVRGRVALAILASAFLGFAVYLYGIRAQVKAIAMTIPIGDFSSYGRQVLFRWYNAAHPGVLSPGAASAWLIVAVWLLAALVWRRAPHLSGLSESKLEGLMVGSVLYLSSFVLHTNRNYRLIFLLFTLPALLGLLRGGSVFHRVVAAAGLILLGIGWGCSDQCNFYLVMIKELANWAVFALMSFLWLQCLPESLWQLATLRLASTGPATTAPSA